MALNPIRAVSFALLWTFWVSAMTAATVTPDEIPECSGWDVVTGCDETKSKIMATMAFGTVPGLGLEWNALFAILGVTARLTAIWGLLELIRGV